MSHTRGCATSARPITKTAPSIPASPNLSGQPDFEHLLGLAVLVFLVGWLLSGLGDGELEDGMSVVRSLNRINRVEHGSGSTSWDAPKALRADEGSHSKSGNKFATQAAGQGG